MFDHYHSNNLKTRFGRNGEATTGEDPPRFDQEVVEFSVLVLGWQAAALEAAAHRHGITAAQMLRRLIRDCTEIEA